MIFPSFQIKRTDVTDAVINDYGDVKVHIMLGPSLYGQYWIYVLGEQHSKFPTSDLFCDTSSTKFCTVRLSLSEAFERTRWVTRTPNRECKFEVAAPIILKNCPLCDHVAEYTKPCHGELWGHWDKKIMCSNDDCGANVRINNNLYCVEEKLAHIWNNRI